MINYKVISPVDKVYKRIINGPQDNALSFYDISLLIIIFEINKTIT